MPLIVTLVISTVAGLASRFGVSTASRFDVPFALPGQGVGKRVADRAVLVADQQVDMGDFIAFARQRFADEHASSSRSPR